MGSPAFFPAQCADQSRLSSFQDGFQAVYVIYALGLVVVQLIGYRKVIRYVVYPLLKPGLVSFYSEIILHVLGQDISDIHYGKGAF